MDAEKRRDPCGHTVLCPSARQNSYLSLLSLISTILFAVVAKFLIVFENSLQPTHNKPI